MTAFSNAPLPIISQIISVIQQSIHMDWPKVIAALQSEGGGGAVISLSGLAAFDNMANDRRFGVCPIPLYELSDSDWEMMRSDGDVPAIREKLKTMGVYQYFYPAPDELALSLIDRGVTEASAIGQSLSTAEILGHQLDRNNILQSQTVDIPTILNQLEDAGYVGEGEFGFEIQEAGKTFRASIRVRPKEGLVSKLINKISVSIGIDPSRFYGG